VFWLGFEKHFWFGCFLVGDINIPIWTCLPLSYRCASPSLISEVRAYAGFLVEGRGVLWFSV